MKKKLKHLELSWKYFPAFLNSSHITIKRYSYDIKLITQRHA